MKIVMGVHHYPPDSVAGVELITERTARWLMAHGHSVEVVCVTSIEADAHLTAFVDVKDGVVVHRLGLSLDGAKEPLGLRFRDEVLGRWFAGYLERAKPDLFHAQSCYLLGARTVEAATRAVVPTVVSLHDYWFLCPRITLLRPNGRRCIEPGKVSDCTWCLMTERRRYRLIGNMVEKLWDNRGRMRVEHSWLRWLLSRDLLAKLIDRQSYLSSILRSADQLVVSCQLARDLLVVSGFPSVKIKLLPYGIELGRFHGLTRTPRDGGLRIGYLGQLAPLKGIHILLEAFNRLHSPDRPPELKVYGDVTRFPDYVKKLKTIARGNPRIQFFGAYDNCQVENILAGIDVLVVPSLWFETGPLVTLEAFAARVPVVATRLPNMQHQIQHGVDGLLFDPGNAASLAQQLQRLIDEPVLLSQLARGIGTVRTVDQEVAELEEVYRRVVRRGLSTGSIAS